MFRGAISITGDLGSGKSTVARLLANHFQARLISTGSIQRNIARQMGLDTLELNKYAETHPEIDSKIDQIVIDLSSSDDKLVFDSRMAWHFVPKSFKVYIEVDPAIAASRLINDTTRTSEQYSNLGQAIDYLTQRRISEHERFRRLYKVDDEDITKFDAVVNSSFVNPAEIVELLAKLIAQREPEMTGQSVWLSPRLLIPTQSVRELPATSSGDVPQDGPAIEVIRWRRCYFILDGHKRSSNALLAQRRLIPVQVVTLATVPAAGGMSIEPYLRTSVRRHWIHDWEAAHRFQFASYRCLDEVLAS
jgi:CMP/dCMP kinase